MSHRSLLLLFLISHLVRQSTAYEISAPAAKHFLHSPLSKSISRETVETQREVMDDLSFSLCLSISPISSVSMNTNNTHGFTLVVHRFPLHALSTAMRHPSARVCFFDSVLIMTYLYFRTTGLRQSNVAKSIDSVRTQNQSHLLHSHYQSFTL